VTATVEDPAVAAYRAVRERDAGGAEVRSILDALSTDQLLPVETAAVRVIWAARDLRQQRHENEGKRR
jgi:hypothetical protein